jgi:hypothetical protein
VTLVPLPGGWVVGTVNSHIKVFEPIGRQSIQSRQSARFCVNYQSVFESQIACLSTVTTCTSPNQDPTVYAAVKREQSQAPFLKETQACCSSSHWRYSCNAHGRSSSSEGTVTTVSCSPPDTSGELAYSIPASSSSGGGTTSASRSGQSLSPRAHAFTR